MKKMFKFCMDEVKEFAGWHRFADYVGMEINGLKTITDPVTETIQP